MRYLDDFIIIILLVIFFIGGISIMGYSDPYAIKQEVTPIEPIIQQKLASEFQDSLEFENAYRFENYVSSLVRPISLPRPKEIKLDNPYKYGNIIYKLVSTCRDSTYTDFGNKQKILMFKCKRYKQLLRVKNFESTKFDVIRKDLDEMNEKTCK